MFRYGASEDPALGWGMFGDRPDDRAMSVSAVARHNEICVSLDRGRKQGHRRCQVKNGLWSVTSFVGSPARGQEGPHGSVSPGLSAFASYLL